MSAPRTRWLRRGALALSVAVLGACSGDSDSAGDDRPPPQELRIGLAYDVGGLGDGGPNDAALVGLSRAEDELGAVVETFEPDSTGSDRADIIDLLVGNDVDLVIGIGSGYGDAIAGAARRHPETSFAIVDGGAVDAPNVTSFVFREEQSAYLVGAAAALSGGGAHLGLVTGPDDARTQLLQAGYTAGAKKVTPSARVDVARLPPPAEGSSLDADAAKVLALAQYAAGARVVLAAPAALAGAVFSAAVERGGGVRAIGVDTDHFATASAVVQPVVLTSLLKRIDIAVFQAIEAVAGGDGGSGVVRLGLVEGAVGYATSGGSIAPEVLTRLDGLEAEIVAGQIQVPTVP